MGIWESDWFLILARPVFFNIKRLTLPGLFTNEKIHLEKLFLKVNKGPITSFFPVFM